MIWTSGEYFYPTPSNWTSSTSSPTSQHRSPSRTSDSCSTMASTPTHPGSAAYRAAAIKRLHVRPITPTVMRANGSKAGAYDGRDSSGWSGRKTRCSVHGAAAPCGSSRLSPTEPLSTGYSATSGSSTPTLRRRAIIPRPGHAGRLSGEPRTPHEPPLCPLGAGRSLPQPGPSTPHPGSIVSLFVPTGTRWSFRRPSRQLDDTESAVQHPQARPIRPSAHLDEDSNFLQCNGWQLSFFTLRHFLFFKWHTRTGMSNSYITWPANRLDVTGSATFSSEIRPTCTMQQLIVIDYGCQLSFFTLRERSAG